MIDAVPEKPAGRRKLSGYQPPKMVIHSGAAFIRKLGAAQACSPSPGF